MKGVSYQLYLSTTKSAGLGEHIEHLKMTIVLAEPFKSNVIAQQTLGRTRDKNTVYIISIKSITISTIRNLLWSRFAVPLDSYVICMRVVFSIK